MRKFRLPLAAFFALFLAASCTLHNVDDLRPPPQNACELAYSFTDTIQTIVNTNCAIPTCHVPGGFGTGDFTSYGGVQAPALNGRLRNVTIDLGLMPPADSPGPKALSECELKILENWIGAGAPQ